MVSVLVIIDNYFINKFCLEAMETEIELLAVNGTGGDDCSKILADIINAKPNNHVIRVGEIDEMIYNKAKAYNRLLQEAKGDYVCIFNAYATVGAGWLHGLISGHSVFPKVGAIAIPEFDAKKIYSGAIDKNEEVVNVWRPKTDDGSVSGIILSRADLLNAGNCFDETKDDFISEFTGRVTKHGWENFYAPGQIQIDNSVNGRSIDRQGVTI